MTKQASRESGHDKNLGNFYALVQFCESLGPSYQPARADLALTALHNAYTQAKDLMDNLHRTEVELAQTVSARLRAFDALPILSTRIMNLLRSGNASSDVLKAARHYSGKLHNRRLGPDPQAAGQNADPADGPQKSRGSVIQSSFNSRLAHIEQMVRIAEAEPTYASAEPDLQTATLNDLVNQLVTLNRKVVELTNQHRLLIADRKERFYSASIGLLARSRAVRHYITARYGVRSQQEKAANAFLLTVIR
jgi:hypothetical protein